MRSTHARVKVYLFNSQQQCVTNLTNTTFAQLYVIYRGVELNFAYCLITLFTASKKSFSVATYKNRTYKKNNDTPGEKEGLRR